MKTFVLGITGVIGSGKSTLCQLLEERGFVVIRADDITHALYKKGEAGYATILNYFGKNYVGKYEVSRPKLRRLVLTNQHKMWILNTVIHPLIVNEVYKKIDQLKKTAQNTKYSGTGATLRVALESFYFEKKDLGKVVNELIRIDATDEIITERLKDQAREVKPDELKKWLLFQRKILFETPVTFLNTGTKAALAALLDNYLSSKLQ